MQNISFFALAIQAMHKGSQVIVSVGDLKLDAILECWWPNLDVGAIFWMLVTKHKV